MRKHPLRRTKRCANGSADILVCGFTVLSYVFSVLAARADGASRLRRFRVASRLGIGITKKPYPRKLRTVKRPEGRAPAQILVGTLNTYVLSSTVFLDHLALEGPAPQTGSTLQLSSPRSERGGSR